MPLTRQDLASLPLLHEGRATLVYLQEQSEYGLPVVIKVLRPGTVAPGAAERLVNEHELTKNLDIPGIRRSLDYVTIDGSPALVLAYVRGAEARAAFRGDRPLEDTLVAASSMAGALDRLHRHKIMHRNLSGSNILIGEDLQATIIDLDMAAREDRAVRPEGLDLFEGSLQYVSPEQTGRVGRPVDPRSDLYSLGAVLYEMFTGTPPFRASGPSELVHQILARNPTPVSDVSPAVPRAVSAIVMKLLAKSPEDRYQSAHGLQADLEKALDRLRSAGRVESFPLGAEDLSGAFRIPEKLYGRERETAALLTAIERASRGHAEPVLVIGPPGVGKTALVRDMRRFVAKAGGYFVSGKPGEYQKNVPYFALVQAFTELADLVLTETPEGLAAWKARVLQAVGSNGRLLVDMIPRLELILGPQPPVPELGPEEAQNRFRLMFTGFIRAIARADHPLVLFIDNLQWADPATLNLLKPLAAGRENPCLLFIGACRSAEAGPPDQLPQPVEALAEENEQARILRIGNLSDDALNSLVSDTLRCDPVYARPLSNLLFEKTGGNPLFAIQFFQSLYDEDYLAFSYDLGRWEWDSDHIRGMGITDNVAVLAMQKIERLPENTRHLLSLAACLGDRFDVDLLASVTDLQAPDVLDSLWPAVEAGLLLAAGEPRAGQGAFEFLHDRIRKASYSLLPRRQKKLVHLKVGRLLLEETPEASLEDRIFTIAGHLNEGFQYVENARERLRLVELNLAAGRKAKREAAYQAAIWYFSMGIGILPADKWARYYRLTLDLYMEAIEAEYLSRNFERADLLSREVLHHTDDLLTRSRVYELRVLFHAAQGQDEEAILAGLEALELLGISLPGDEDALKAYSDELRREISGEVSRVEDLARLPEMSDARQLTLMRLMASLVTPAYRLNPALFNVLVPLMVLASIRYGNSPGAAFAYGWYAALLCGPYADIGAGYSFGRLSLGLQEHYRAREVEAKVLFLFSAFVRPWTEDARSSVKPLLEAYRVGLETGDLDQAFTAASHYCGYLLCTGHNLGHIERTAAKCLEQIGRLRPGFHTSLAQVWTRAVAGLVAEPARNRGPDEAVGGNPLLRFCQLFSATVLRYLAGDIGGAVAAARRCEAYEAYGEGYLYFAYYYLFYALALLAYYPEAGEGERASLIAAVERIQRRMKLWAAHAPANFGLMSDLIEAEKVRTAGDTGRAVEMYGRAILGAKDNGSVNLEGLAYELEGKFYLSLGRDDIAGVSIRKACDCYRLWGAASKVAGLEKQYRYLLARERSPSLDAAAIVTASRALSQELQIGHLMDKLMSITIESAGAEKGVLLMARDGVLVVQAIGTIGAVHVEAREHEPFEASGEVPVSVVNYVARTQAPVVLNDAYHDSTYGSDLYIAERHTRSLLCLPILHHGTLSGILYLENNLATNVFTPDRLELLKALSYQAAISIENAYIYDALRESESRFRTLAETSSAGIIVYRKKYLYVNPAAVKLSGYTPDELLTLNVWDIVQPDFRDMVRKQVLGRLDKRASPNHYEFQIVRKDGETRWVDVSATSFTFQGHPAGLGVMIDTTDRKRAEEALKTAKAQVEMYLDLMSHDITNMNQIGIGFLEFALGTLDLDESGRELISRPLEALESSTRLIENVRKLQRVIEGGVRHYETDVDAVLRDLISTYSNLLGREIEISYRGCRCTVMANELLTDVFANIIGNAIKHSVGRLLVNITMQKQLVDGKPYCIVAVEDNGPGIPDELKARLFNRFQKGTTRTSGKGLGLYLVKVLVEDYRGKVWLEDCRPAEQRKGCRFVIMLPATES